MKGDLIKRDLDEDHLQDDYLDVVILKKDGGLEEDLSANPPARMTD